MSGIVDVRAMEPPDRCYVEASWLDSWLSRHIGDPLLARMPPDEMRGVLRPLVRYALDACGVRVASFDEDPHYVLGWACVQPPSVICYVYVRDGFRGEGIARSLLSGFDPDEEVRYGCWTRYARCAPGRWRHDTEILWRIAAERGGSRGVRRADGPPGR